MSRWTLRMRLVALLLAALIPVLVLAGWRAVETATAVAGERDRQIAIAADLAVSRQREFLAGTRSLLLALRGNGDVLQSLAAKPPADARDRCEAYFQRVLSEAPGRYSALMLTDRMGLSLCSSAPVPPGTSFADRDVFALARQARDFVVAPTRQVG